MGMWIVRRPNGDISLAFGESKDNLFGVLDDVGDPSNWEMIRFTSEAAIHLKLQDDGELGYEGILEVLLSKVMLGGDPILGKVLVVGNEQEMREDVKQERERLS